MRTVWAMVIVWALFSVDGAIDNRTISVGRADDGAQAAAPRFRWQETDASIALLAGERIVWQFNHLQDGLGKGAPYFHPLVSPDGAVLTDLRPADHVWHRGLRFAWKAINGLDGYWTWPEGLEQFPDATGQTKVTSVRVEKGSDFSARFELEASYLPPGQPPDLTEKRTIRVSPPDSQGGYQIDWHGVFTAGQRGARLERTPILGEPDGKPWGGYAGLQFRFAPRTDFAAWSLRNSEGLTAASSQGGAAAGLPQMHGKPARWLRVALDFTDGKSASVTLFDHPDNLRHPAAWHVSSMPNELIQTPLFYAPYTLPAGKSLEFTYRISIARGHADVRSIDDQWRRFAQSSDD